MKTLIKWLIKLAALGIIGFGLYAVFAQGEANLSPAGGLLVAGAGAVGYFIAGPIAAVANFFLSFVDLGEE
tara:strand:+ start:605 stop:817 length:213 start_codon:yes stop_codon:yes gene_type:complete